MKKLVVMLIAVLVLGVVTRIHSADASLKSGVYLNKETYHKGETVQLTIVSDHPNETLMLTEIGPKEETLLAGEIRTNSKRIYTLKHTVLGQPGKYMFYTLNARDKSTSGGFKLVVDAPLKSGVYFDKESYRKGEKAQLTIVSDRPNETLMLTVIGPKGDVLHTGEIKTDSKRIYTLKHTVLGQPGKYMFYTLDIRDKAHNGGFKLVK